MEKWFEEVISHYPFDTTQLEMKTALENGDDMPFITVDGVRHYYDNGREHSAILDILEDASYSDICREKDKAARREADKIILSYKKEMWEKELAENMEYIDWFYGFGYFDGGACEYLNSLEFPYYDRRAQMAEEEIEKLKRKIKYARR